MKKLSICIPTYNRSDRCLRLVNEILKSNNPNIEIIVSDNYSTDNTFDLLKQIDDKRLFIYQMKQNLGSLLNMFATFSKARSEFIYFTTDKDFINIINLDTFLSFLENNENLSCGYCAYSSKSETADEIYLQGFEAINKIGYIGHHPSGFFFHRDKLENVKYAEKFSDKDFVGEFALDFIIAELACKGNVGIFHKELTIPQNSNDAANDKSLSIKGMNVNAYYTPNARLNIAINQSTHINSLELSSDEKKMLIMKTFMYGLINATYGYKNILKNKDICAHYYLESKNIGVFKMIIIASEFYIKYIQKTKFERHANNLNTINFTFYLFGFVINKMIKRFKYAQ